MSEVRVSGYRADHVRAEYSHPIFFSHAPKETWTFTLYFPDGTTHKFSTKLDAHQVPGYVDELSELLDALTKDNES